MKSKRWQAAVADLSIVFLLAGGLSGCVFQLPRPSSQATVTVTAPPGESSPSGSQSAQPSTPSESASTDEEPTTPTEEPGTTPAEEPSSAPPSSEPPPSSGPSVLSPTPKPSISGTAQVGRLLSAEAGAWGPGTVHLAYRWYRAGDRISGADDDTYRVVAADLGKAIKVRVTGSKSGYTSVSRYSDETAAVIRGVLSPGSPSLTGQAKVGHVLTAVPGHWGPGTVTLHYSWWRGMTLISGAHAATYTLAAADLGNHVRVRVTGSKSGYESLARYSAATPSVIPGTFKLTPMWAPPHIVRVGQMLDARVTWTPSPVTLTYQWFHNATPITGATSATYRVRVSDLGAQLRVRVHGAKPGYTGQTKMSAASSAVAPGLLSPTPTPAIWGVRAVGGLLHTSAGSWGPAPVSLTYQWRRDGVNIPGATSATRIATLADHGHRLSVAVTGHKTGYVTTTRVSGSVAIP